MFLCNILPRFTLRVAAGSSDTLITTYQTTRCHNLYCGILSYKTLPSSSGLKRYSSLSTLPLFNFEDGGSMFLRNVCNRLPRYHNPDCGLPCYGISQSGGWSPLFGYLVASITFGREAAGW
jgi:hypothetical protein